MLPHGSKNVSWDTATKVPLPRRYTTMQPLALGGMLYMYNRYAAVGHLVHLQDAQVVIKSYHARGELADAKGNRFWVTFPLKNRKRDMPFNEAVLHEPLVSRSKLGKTLDLTYGKCGPYRALKDEFQSLLDHTFVEGCTLADVNIPIVAWCLKTIGLKLNQYMSLDILPVRPDHPSAWMAAFGQALVCDLYVGGSLANSNYMRPEDWSPWGGSYLGQWWKCQDPTIDVETSVLDLLFRQGVEAVNKAIAGPAWPATEAA